MLMKSSSKILHREVGYYKPVHSSVKALRWWPQYFRFFQDHNFSTLFCYGCLYNRMSSSYLVLRHVFLRILRFYFVSIIPRMLHTHIAVISHRCYVTWRHPSTKLLSLSLSLTHSL
jgi:hypothetical protein